MEMKVDLFFLVGLRRHRVAPDGRVAIAGHHFVHGRLLPHPHRRHQLQRGCLLR